MADSGNNQGDITPRRTTRRTAAAVKTPEESPVKSVKPASEVQDSNNSAQTNVTDLHAEGTNGDVNKNNSNNVQKPNDTTKNNVSETQNVKVDKNNSDKSQEPMEVTECDPEKSEKGSGSVAESAISNSDPEVPAQTESNPQLTLSSSLDKEVNNVSSAKEDLNTKAELSKNTSEVDGTSDVEPIKNKPTVPELEEETLNKNGISDGNIPRLGLVSPKTKIKLNIIPKETDDIVEVPVVKPKIDIIDVLDEEMGDTEVVSEDELPPPPTEEKVDGAEEVSDEELPAAPKPDAPQGAEEVSDEELPAAPKPDAPQGAEEVSDEELPAAPKPDAPQGAEEVSDEELPAAPKPDLPPEAEDVSDDELVEPVEKKKKLETKTETKNKKKKEADTKKPIDDKEKVEKDTSSVKRPREEVPSSKSKSAEESVAKKPREKSPAKKLPELEKYWNTVRLNPTDFTGWTYLLQYVDQGLDLEAAEEAYSAFLSHYPYCYGYWRKYADYEKKKGTQTKSEEVFDQGLKAIPLSVDLWHHYLNYVKSVYADNPEHIRKQFQRCVDICGLEFRADRLWDNYIKWEISQKELIKAREVYDRVLKIPLQGHTTHYENFLSFVASNSPKDILPVDEFLSMRLEVLPSLKKSKDSPMLAADNLAPGAKEEGPPGEEESTVVLDADEANAMREKIVALRRKIHKATAVAVSERWSFEEGIKRPYFHVKALEKCQLKNWKDYLDFEMGKGIPERIEVLFERCLIACALYEEFWHKYICYLRDIPSPDVEKIRDVFTRSCTVHHPKKVNMHFDWAAFEEAQENPDKAREILDKIEKEHPKLIEIPMRRIALEKRQKQGDSVTKLYEKYLDLWKANPDWERHYYDLIVKYARYCCLILKDVDKAIGVLKGGLESEKELRNLQHYTRLYLQLVDTALHRPVVQCSELVCFLDLMVAERSSLSPQQKFHIVAKKLELLEEFGDDVTLINKTITEFRELAEQVKKIQEAQKALLPERKEIPTQIISTNRKPKPSQADAVPNVPLPPNPPPSQPPPTPFFPGPQQTPPFMAPNPFPTQAGPYAPPTFPPPYGVDPNNPAMYGGGWYGTPNYGPGQQWGPYPGYGPPPNQRRF